MRPEGETKSVKPPNCSPTGQRFCYHTEHFPIRTFFFLLFACFISLSANFYIFFSFFSFLEEKLTPTHWICTAISATQFSESNSLLSALRACFPPHLSSSFPPPQTTHRGAAPHAGGLNPSIIAEELGVEGQGCFLAAFDSHAV